jgi:hypothetical protein
MLILFAIAILSSIQQAQPCSSESPYCKVADGQYMRCENFTSFADIRFKNKSTQCAALDLYPSVPLLFNHTLNLTGINITDSLAISNLIGIDVSKQLIIGQPNLLAIEMSQFNLYYSGVLIDTLEKCSQMESADVSKKRA